MLKLVTFAATFVVFSLNAATTETWDFTGNGSWNSSATLQSDLGNSATLTAWSSAATNGTVAQSNFYLNSYGTNVNGHGVDSFNGSQFILLEFDRAVELGALMTSWNEWNGSAGQAWLSVAGFDSNPFAGTQNWSDVAALTSVKSAYSNSQLISGNASQAGAMRLTDFSDAAQVQVSGNTVVSGIAKTTWLIGAYNHHFNLSSDLFYDRDKFKFSSLTTVFNQPTTDVATPASLGLLVMGLLLLRGRRRQIKLS